MSVRTAPSKVKDVLISGKQYDSRTNPDLTRFIAWASKVVDWVVSKDTDGVLDSDTAIELETWLAAHAYAAADQLLQSKSTMGASGNFQGQTGKYFESTYYGQYALSMDPTGWLTHKQGELTRGMRATAGVIWNGVLPENDSNFWNLP